MKFSASYKMIVAAGAMLAIVGSGASSFADDLMGGMQAQTGPRLDFPAGLAVDGRSVFVASSRNNTVDQIDLASKSISIVAGKLFESGSNDGVGAAARCKSPDGMAMVGQDLFLCDTNNSDIRKINVATKAVTTIAGEANIAGTEDAKGSAAHFNLPTQISTDGKSLFVADSGNSTIRRINLADMAVKTVGGQAGTPGKADGNQTKSQFSGPRGVAVDTKFVYVSDTGNDQIRKIDLSSLEASVVAGTGEAGDANGPADKAQFNNPGAMCTDGTNLFVLDADNHAVRKIVLASGEVSTVTQVNGHIGSGCALSSDGKQLYFSDTTQNSVEVVDIGAGSFQTLYPPGQ